MKGGRDWREKEGASSETGKDMNDDVFMKEPARNKKGNDLSDLGRLVGLNFRVNDHH